MQVSAATPIDVFTTAMGMRERDYAEIEAMAPVTGRCELADYLSNIYGGHPEVLSVRNDNGALVVVGGLIEWRPNVASLFLYATELFPTVAKPLTRFIRDDLIANAQKRGVHRFEAVSLASYETAHRWLGHIGLAQEAVCRGYGKRGEDYIQFSKVIDVRKTGD